MNVLATVVTEKQSLLDDSPGSLKKKNKFYSLKNNPHAKIHSSHIRDTFILFLPTIPLWGVL